MMFQVGDDGVVSSINEEDLIYIDKNELDKFVESYHKLEKENKQLKQVAEEFIENQTQHNLWKLRTILKALKGDLE